MTSHQVISWPHPVLWLTRFHRRPGFGNDLSCGIFNGNKLRWEAKRLQIAWLHKSWQQNKTEAASRTPCQHILQLQYCNILHLSLTYCNIHIYNIGIYCIFAKHLVEHDENLLVVLKLFIWYLHRILRKKRIITWESGTPSLTISGAPKYAYLMAIFGIFGRVFGRPKYGQVGYPWKDLAKCSSDALVLGQ